MRTASRSEGLDPDRDYTEIYRNIALYEFPWDVMQALSFALFRTYAVPSIGSLLAETGELVECPQKRHDDTVLLLEAPLVAGFDSPSGRAGVRRINQMHKMYDISNDDMIYVLSTFVVVPVRWIDDFGWRRLTQTELSGLVRYYQELGRLMGIKDIPPDYQSFAEFSDEYERRHVGYDPGGCRVAESTMSLFESFYPFVPARAVNTAVRAILDPPLLRAFGFRRPATTVSTMVVAGLKLRARFVAMMPPRRKPVHARNLSRIRSYPQGFDVSGLGVFGAAGCPVSHRRDADSSIDKVAHR